MLLCHPYPNEYVDSSKPCPNSAFFMGLRKKEGGNGQERQQFDIRETVDEFRDEINMYMFWKPGMDIFVSHVRRKQLPTFVFPDGHKRSRSSKNASERAGESCEDNKISPSGSSVRHRRRKREHEMDDAKPEKTEKRPSLCLENQAPVSPESIACLSGNTSAVDGNIIHAAQPITEQDSDKCKKAALAVDRGDGHVSMASKKQLSVSRSNFPVVNGTASAELVEPNSEPELCAPCAVHFAEFQETCKMGVNYDRTEVPDCGYMKGMEGVSSRIQLSREDGTTEGDQEFEKTCNQFSVIGSAETDCKTTLSTQSLNCEVSFFVLKIMVKDCSG